MQNIRTLISVALACGGLLALCGCHQQATGSNGVPFPSPHAAPPVQTQIQQIESDPHIPAAQKALIESHIAHGGGVITEKTPTKVP